MTSTLHSGVGYNPNRNDDGTFANGSHAETDLELTGEDHTATDAPEEFRLGGLTAAEHRAWGQRSRQTSLDSFDRSDTDGFATQAAGDLMSSLHQRQAEICDDNGMIEVRALFDADGSMVAAKRIQTRYGMSWGVLESDDPNSDIKSWFNESEAENETRRIKTNAKKGFYVGVVKAPGNARIGGGGTGMGGMSSCYVQTYRTDGGFARDVQIIDNGKAAEEPVAPVPARAKVPTKFYFDDKPELRSSYDNQRQLANRDLGPVPCVHGITVDTNCVLCRASGTALVPLD